MPGRVKRRRGFTHLSPKRQITLPISVVERAGLTIGEELAVEVDGGGRVIVSRSGGESVGDRRRRAGKNRRQAPRCLADGRARRAAGRAALIALDASVLIALLDSGDVHHPAARAALAAHAEEDLRVPVHTLAEALVHPARAGKDREVRNLIAAFEIAVDPVDETIAVAAAKLRARHGKALRMPDALVIAYADVCKATRLLTADARWTSWSRRVELVAG